jgi:hypothetical protein
MFEMRAFDPISVFLSIAALLSHGSAHHIIEKGLYSSPVFRISILNPEARYIPFSIGCSMDDQ